MEETQSINNTTCKRNSGKTLFVHALLIIAVIILLSYVDFIMLEKVYHPLAREHGVSWSAFHAVLFQKEQSFLWWHVAFFPMGVCIFLLLGIAAVSFRLPIAGILLFATGWEDIGYYVIQGNWLPAELPWLDHYSPIISLTRFITSTEHVTDTGVLIAALAGLIISFLILFSVNPFSCCKKLKSNS